nr:hypothetical protein [Endozoicomonas sp.]
MAAENPAIGSLLTTDSPANPQAPNPQKILLQGKIQLSNGSNQMMLDLAANSLINSQLDIARGNVSWQFHSPSAKWITVPGSRVGRQGNLQINFVNGGIWQVPLSPDNQVSNPGATAPLIIEQGGEFTVNGQGIVLGKVQTELQPGEQQKYVLVKKSFAGAGNEGLNLNLAALPVQTGLNLDLSALSLQLDKPDYMLTLEQENEENAGYLYATLTHSEEPLPPDQRGGTIFWVPVPPDPATKALSLAALNRDGAFAQQLPVNMVDQIIASRLLQASRGTAFCKQQPNTVWIGQCLDETDEPFSLWVLPLYDHITAKDFAVANGNIGFKANIRGLGLQLVQNTHWGHWGGGLFSGKGDINSTEFNTPIRSDVDYLGGLIQGAVKVNPWVVNLG